MKSMRQSCICGQEGLCESISKIIHVAVATHFRLPVPITGVSGEGDRAGHGVAWGRFCLICHQRPGDPHPLSCPLYTHTPPSSPLFIRLTSAQLSSSMHYKEGRPHCSFWLCFLCHLSRAWQWLHRHFTKSVAIRGKQEVLFELHRLKLLSEKLWF